MADNTYVVVNWTQRSVGRFPELNEARAALRDLLADGDEYTIWSMAEASGSGTPTDRGTFQPGP
jgi:hypothetical protein